MVTFGTDFWAPGMNSLSHRRLSNVSPSSERPRSPEPYLNDFNDSDYAFDSGYPLLHRPLNPQVLQPAVAGKEGGSDNGRPSGTCFENARPYGAAQLPPHPPLVPMEGGVPPKRPTFLTRFLHADYPGRLHSPLSTPPDSPSFEHNNEAQGQPTVDQNSNHHGGRKGGEHSGGPLLHAPVPHNVARKNHLRDMLNRKASLNGKDALKKEVSGSRPSSPALDDVQSLSKKYGVCERGSIGQGATAVVRLVKLEHTTDSEKFYAVKEFRKRRKDETEREYVKKLAAEFCISSSLHHVNVIETVDLVQDENQHWCEVMEYCPGGDLYNAIKSGCMSKSEINCCFKQLIIGVGYLHSMGVAHRDIKPENLLLDVNGHLKITDFGVSEVFRMCWEKNPHLSKPGILGSEPYIAPEMFLSVAYDAREVDVWACGIVYYCMLYQCIPWRMACPKDSLYAAYIEQRARAAYEPLQRLDEGCRQLLTRTLEPDPSKRIRINEILCDPWFRSIGCCSAETETALATATESKDVLLQQPINQVDLDSKGDSSVASSSLIFAPPTSLSTPAPSPILEEGRRALSPLGCAVAPETHHHIPEDVLAAHLIRARKGQPTPPNQ